MYWRKGKDDCHQIPDYLTRVVSWDYNKTRFSLTGDKSSFSEWSCLASYDGMSLFWFFLWNIVRIGLSNNDVRFCLTELVDDTGNKKLENLFVINLWLFWFQIVEARPVRRNSNFLPLKSRGGVALEIMLEFLLILLKVLSLSLSEKVKYIGGGIRL